MRSTFSFLLRMLFLSLIFAAATCELRAQTYTVTDLGVLAGDSTSAGLSVNSQGHVVGCSGAPPYVCPNPNLPPAGFVWNQQAGIQALNPPAGQDFSSPFAINDLDEVVGYSSATMNGATQFHAVMWSDGTVRGLGTLFPKCGGGVCSTFAEAISQNELVTGCAGVPPYGNTHAFLWNQKRGMLDLGTLGYGDSCGVAVNNNGAVAGWLNDIAFATIGFFWTPADGMQQIYPLPGADYVSPATGINSSNQVVGQTAYVGGDFTYFHAYLWSKGKGMTDLGVLGSGPASSQAQAINDNSQVVGWSGSSAFIWSQEQGMVDLNTLIDPNSGWVLNSANSITNNGLIAGSGMINGESHAFLLTPKTSAH